MQFTMFGLYGEFNLIFVPEIRDGLINFNNNDSYFMRTKTIQNDISNLFANFNNDF